LRKLATSAYKIWNATSMIAGIFLIFNMVVIIANILMRRIFGAPIFGSTEIVSYASLITASLALAQNEWFDGNIRMTIILDTISKKTSKIIQFVDYIVCSVAFIYISYLLIGQAQSKFRVADVSTDLELPLYIFAGCLALGFILLTVCIILKTAVIGYGAFTGEEINLKRPSGKEDIPLEDA